MLVNVLLHQNDANDFNYALLILYMVNKANIHRPFYTRSRVQNLHIVVCTEYNNIQLKCVYYTDLFFLFYGRGLMII